MNLNPVDIVIGLIWIYFLFTGIKSGFILQLAQIISIVVLSIQAKKNSVANSSRYKLINL